MKRLLVIAAAILLSACSSMTPEEMAKTYFESLIANDVSAMQKVTRTGSDAFKFWDRVSPAYKRKPDLESYKMLECANRASGNGQVCDIAIKLTSGRSSVLYVHVISGSDGMKVDQALWGTWK
jgi:hypothetical protein